MIRSQDAMFIWNEDDDGLIERCAVVDRSNPPLTRDEHLEDRRQTYEYDMSFGACCMGWMEPGSGLHYLTPESMFLEFAFKGFASVDAFHQALAAFAECDTCDWAREIKARPERWEADVARRLRQSGKPAQ